MAFDRRRATLLGLVVAVLSFARLGRGDDPLTIGGLAFVLGAVVVGFLIGGALTPGNLKRWLSRRP
jgi:hypothetical protein